MSSTFLSLCAMFPVIYPSMSDYQVRMVCKYEKTIEREASRNDIDPYLLGAMIFVESSYFPRAESSAGACGLTQVIPKWTGGRETKRKKYTCEQLKRPRTSIRVGAQVLSYSIRVYAKGDIDKGICYYNAGAICLRKGFKYKRMKYVTKVKTLWELLQDGC